MYPTVADLFPAALRKSPVTNMADLINILRPSTIIPEVDKYYVFVYKAKTPNTVYDQHPLVYVTGIFKWGFTGWNDHMGPRRYTWAEIVTNLYHVDDDNLNDVAALPIKLLKRT
jgi:hypothetical protein